MFNFANSVSRTSRTSSRARSSIFTDAGDIEMDFFTRQVKRLEASMQEAEDKKSILRQENAKNKLIYKEMKNRVANFRKLIEEREKNYSEKLKQINDVINKEEEVLADHEKAIQTKEELENHIKKAHQTLQEIYIQINEYIDETKQIPQQNPDFAPLTIQTEAYRTAVSERKRVIHENEEEKEKLSKKLHELEIQEMSLNNQIENLDLKVEFYQTRSSKAFEVLTLPNDIYSLPTLEKLVDHLEKSANQSEMRYSTLANDKEESSRDYRNELFEMERTDTQNLRRRQELNSKHETYQQEMKEIQQRMNARKGLVIEGSTKVQFVKSKRSNEEVYQIIDSKSQDLSSKFKQLAEETNKLDQLELENILYRNKMEKEWTEKMQKIDELRKETVVDDQTIIKVNEYNELIDQSKQQIELNTSKIDTLRRRAQLAEEERQKNIELNPEINFAKERVEGKKKKTDDKQANLDQRKRNYEETTQITNELEKNMKELLQRTVEIEKQRGEKGIEVEQAKERMMTEQELFDQALAKIPLDQKIAILHNL